MTFSQITLLFIPGEDKYHLGESFMIEAVLYLFIGALIGWNFPQPQFAKNLQAKLLELFTKPKA